jgi:HEAT repeat protein
MDDKQKSAEIRNKLLLLRSRELDAWDLASLAEMSTHEDAGIRDWATFAIAARDDDGEAVRQLLLDRVDDPDFEVRSEALWGLARRRDARVMPIVIKALEAEYVGSLAVEAAGYLAHPSFVGALKELEGCWNADPALLTEAIARCRGEQTSGHRWEFIPANDERS